MGVHWSIEALIAAGALVVARTTMRGTQRGELFGVPPTNRVVAYPGMHVVRVADGRVAEHRGSHDDPGLMWQLGVIQEEAAERPRGSGTTFARRTENMAAIDPGETRVRPARC